MLSLFCTFLYFKVKRHPKSKLKTGKLYKKQVSYEGKKMARTHGKCPTWLKQNKTSHLSPNQQSKPRIKATCEYVLKINL